MIHAQTSSTSGRVMQKPVATYINGKRGQKATVILSNITRLGDTAYSRGATRTETIYFLVANLVYQRGVTKDPEAVDLLDKFILFMGFHHGKVYKA